MAPLKNGIFIFKIKANHIDPIKDPTKINSIADTINGLII
jgi:hypothetical protein